MLVSVMNNVQEDRLSAVLSGQPAGCLSVSTAMECQIGI